MKRKPSLISGVSLIAAPDQWGNRKIKKEPMNLMTETQMADLPAEQQAKKAIAHVLHQIKANPEIGYHMGVGTQSFALLTEAAATLYNKKLEEVREKFAP